MGMFSKKPYITLKLHRAGRTFLTYETQQDEQPRKFVEFKDSKGVSGMWPSPPGWPTYTSQGDKYYLVDVDQGLIAFMTEEEKQLAIIHPEVEIDENKNEIIIRPPEDNPLVIGKSGKVRFETIRLPLPIPLDMSQDYKAKFIEQKRDEFTDVTLLDMPMLDGSKDYTGFTRMQYGILVSESTLKKVMKGLVLSSLEHFREQSLLLTLLIFGGAGVGMGLFLGVIAANAMG